MFLRETSEQKNYGKVTGDAEGVIVDTIMQSHHLFPSEVSMVMLFHRLATSNTALPLLNGHYFSELGFHHQSTEKGLNTLDRKMSQIAGNNLRRLL